MSICLYVYIKYDKVENKLKYKKYVYILHKNARVFT